MVTYNSVSAAIDVLGKRIGVLECLEEAAKDKRTLVEELEPSRSTIDRSVRELESLGLLTYGDEGYELTVCGQLAMAEYRRFERRIANLLELRPATEFVPPDAFDRELDWLVEGDVLLPEEADPYAMMNRHVELIRRADRGRFALSVVGLHAAEAARDAVVNRGASYELLVDPEVAEVITTSSAYSGLIDEMRETGRLRVYVHEGSLPYSLAIFDDEVVHLAVDENGKPRAVVEADTEDALAWAEQEFETYVRQSSELAPQLTSEA